METFAEPKKLTENPRYKEHRRKCLSGLTDVVIDAPITEVVNGFNRLPYCFTIQSCFGHFIYDGQNDPHNVEPLPVAKSIDRVEYRIAYLAFCLENCDKGVQFLRSLNDITHIDRENIQLCSPQWFWERQINSYALQVEPERFKHEDKAVLDLKEALHVEKVRNTFFAELKILLRKHRI